MQRCHRFAACLFFTIAPFAARAGLPRFPQPDGNRVVFVADGNIWSVATAGGTAIRLTSGAGQDMFPRVSPDGKWIAYTHADLQGTQIQVIPASGGPARQLTFRPTVEPGTGGRHGPDNMVVTWSPDSRFVLYLSKNDAWNGWIQTLYEVPVAGGMPVRMPIDTAVGLLTYGPDGHSIAYNRIFRNFRTWKRYNGGLAQQVFTYDFTSRTLTQITHWSGTNTSPMWVGDRIYYLSDRDSARRANIWVHDLKTGQEREVTHFTDYDIDFPALGRGGIAFQQGGRLWLLALPDESLHAVPINLPDDQPRTRPSVQPVADRIRIQDMAQQVDYALAPNGKRALFSARGDLFSVPAEHGPTRNLTRSQNADEDHPAWSPDGGTIYYTTDSSGEQQIAARPARGGPERLLTHFARGYFYQPIPSPDGKHLAFSDNAHRLWLMDAGGGTPIQVAQDQLNEIHDAAFSPDSRWIAFSMSSIARRRDLYVYEIATAKLTKLGPGGGMDSNPVWTADGKYLLFLSARHENTVMSDVEFDFSVLDSTGIYAIPLARTTPSPMAPRMDEAQSEPPTPVMTGPAASKTGHKPAAKAPANGPAPIAIDFDGIMDRAVLLPVAGGNISQIDTHDHRIFYTELAIQKIEGALPRQKSALHLFDLTTRKDAVIADGIEEYSLAADGKKILVHQGKSWLILDAEAGAGDKPDSHQTLDVSGLTMLVDPPAEWAEMFDNGWRLERDFFFSPVMNGVDWQKIHDRYAKLLPLLGSRQDLNYLIGQVLGEMGNSHTYVGGGDDGEVGTPLSRGVLGVDFALDAASGRYRIARIYPGDGTRAGYVSPLAEPGLGVHDGDYLLAVDGQDLRAPTDPYALMQTIKPGDTVSLSIAAEPRATPREVVIKPVRSELPIREAAWIAQNRAVVDRLSNGRVGYVYLSDMEQLGLQQFVRQFYAQLTKDAVIVDDRWNGGGFVAPMVLERLRRVLVELGTNREAATVTEPEEIIAGPKICLVNHWSASDGDIFPNLFRRYGLGKLVGTRSWGGVRGIRGEWAMMDGGYVTIPEDAIYTLQGQWDVENHGVDPDVTIEDQPADLLAGHDAQLETAVHMLMADLGATPHTVPQRPPLLPPYPPAGMVAPQP